MNSEALARREKLEKEVTRGVTEEAEFRQIVRGLVEKVQASLLSGAENKERGVLVSQCKKAEVEYMRLVVACDVAFAAEMDESFAVPAEARGVGGVMERFLLWHVDGECDLLWMRALRMAVC